MSGSRVQWVQCQACGNLQEADIEGYTIEDEDYIMVKCKKCHQIAAHLLCGNKIEDVYQLYNLNMDPRYY